MPVNSIVDAVDFNILLHGTKRQQDQQVKQIAERAQAWQQMLDRVALLDAMQAERDQDYADHMYMHRTVGHY